MNLQGFYTNLGQALAAKIAAGTAPLTITRVVAGSGHTADIPSAVSLPDIRQTLTVGEAQVSGTTATLPVTLAEAQAEQSYQLTELGVYAADPDAGEVLFQVYQLSSAAAVTAGGESVLRLYLRQSIGEQGVTVTCSPAGVLVDGDLVPIRSALLANHTEAENVTLDAAELQTYLNALPRMLTKHLAITVSGTLTEPLVFQNFYGSGSINLEGGSTARTTLQNGLQVEKCDISMILRHCHIFPDTTGNSAVCVKCSYGNLYLDECVITGNNNSCGLEVSHGGLVVADNCSMSGHETCVLASRGGFANLNNSASGQFSGNTVGAQTWYGGIIVMTSSTPTLLGGSTNDKSGGLIVSGNSVV